MAKRATKKPRKSNRELVDVSSGMVSPQYAPVRYVVPSGDVYLDAFDLRENYDDDVIEGVAIYSLTQIVDLKIR